MDRRTFFASALAALPVVAQTSAARKVEGFEVTDASGKTVPVKLAGGVTVVTFISTRCPVSNGYNDRMNQLFEEYGKKGVRFFFVNANSTEPAAEVEAHRQQAGFAFPVYKDVSAAERLGAEFTPEAYVIDGAGKLTYHGYIDDSRNEARVTNPALRQAIDATLAGKPVANPVTRAFGCTIKRVRRS